MRRFFNIFNILGSKFQHLSLLAIRLVLAYGFYETVVPKWKNIESTSEWFASMNFLFPTLSVYLVTIFESLAVLFFVFGLFTRIISVPLIIIILVAIFSVHFNNGYSLSNNGFEVPLYYLIMLLTLFSFGAGKISLDAAMGMHEK